LSLFAHAVGLALSAWTIVRSGDRTQVLLYAFILDYLFRLATATSVRKEFFVSFVASWSPATRLQRKALPYRFSVFAT